MKVLIFGFGKISYMPYMHFYLEQLRKIDCEIHLFYWNRDMQSDSPVPIDVKAYKFEKFQEDNASIITKAVNFYAYRRLAKKTLKTTKFDFLIILHSLPGFVINDILITEYKHKYILDYRDYTYEHIAPFKKIINKLVNNASATFVSSNAFRKNLPLIPSIYTSHNLDKELLENRCVRKNIDRKVPIIRIRFWGFIRYETINKSIINYLANDIRFELHYHGREQETARILKTYCIQNNFNNVFFHGEYKPEDRYEFAAQTDMIHNMYENDKRTIVAMGNKYYDAIALYIPQICTDKSFMGEIVKDDQVGINVDYSNSNFADILYEYYNSINWKDFETSCDKACEKVLYEYEKGEKEILRILQYM